MSGDAAKFRREYEECRKQAAKTDVAASKEQWLLFADEWLKQARAANALAEREAVEPVAVKESEIDPSRTGSIEASRDCSLRARQGHTPRSALLVLTRTYNAD
ncbi:hypothetical protein [Bradyrhizobium canariense]|uniref:hypothetical protein n=1 Tax=Bradyrhizobium canariense TaxID=255045 RepID=UPI000B901350|nr:hypothetical protein [Bradyrhizobium canariense]